MFVNDMTRYTWDDLPTGTEISQELYEIMQCGRRIDLPDYPHEGFQVGGPYDRKRDNAGRMRSVYLTFVHIGYRYFYAGLNFANECSWRPFRRFRVDIRTSVYVDAEGFEKAKEVAIDHIENGLIQSCEVAAVDDEPEVAKERIGAL